MQELASIKPELSVKHLQLIISLHVFISKLLVGQKLLPILCKQAHNSLLRNPSHGLSVGCLLGMVSTLHLAPPAGSITFQTTGNPQKLRAYSRNSYFSIPKAIISPSNGAGRRSP